MELSWIDVVDTAVKIGFGAVITAISGYLVLIRSQSYESDKEIKERFYKLQDEKKVKYVEFLAQSQELIQSHLYTSSMPNSEEYKCYLRIFNEVQIVSSDEVRAIAYKLMSAISHFIFLNKNAQEAELVSDMVMLAREEVALFQKVAQIEVTQSHEK